MDLPERPALLCSSFRSFGCAESTETRFELVDTAADIKSLLLAGVERVALVAHVKAQWLGEVGASVDHVAAAASRDNGFVNWMNVSFHGYFSGLACRRATLLLNTARN